MRAGAPPVRQACSLITNSSVSETLPFLIASNTISSVISFAMLAGSTGASESLSSSTVPVSTSTT